jgi:hypothetical protein
LPLLHWVWVLVITCATEKTELSQKVIKEQALAIVQHFMKEFLDPRWGGEMELMIESSRDQILGVCNLFVEYNFYVLPQVVLHP